MKKRKKTLVVIDNLHTGGIASSLYNLLYYTHDKLDYHLLVFNKKSIDLSRIPQDVLVLDTPNCLKILGMSQEEIKKESIILYFIRAILVIISKISNGEFARKVLFLCIKKVHKYDLAISFAQDNGWHTLSKGCNDFVIDKVDSTKKLAYIHCDYSNYGGYDPKQEKKLIKFDNIVCVSHSCAQSFENKFPSLKSKILINENFINVDLINEKKLEYVIEYPKNKTNFVTVCRISSVKGLDRALLAFKIAQDKGVDNFSWTIVGDGPERETLKLQIEKYQLNSKIKLVGNKDNPYPYILGADIFLLPSIHEAAPMVFGEAAVLNVPILTTKTCSANELVLQKRIGKVMENNQESITNNIMSAICNKKMIHFEYSLDINHNAKAQFENIIENEKNGDKK